MIDNLLPIARCNPQAAFCVLNYSIKFKSTYIFRTTPLDPSISQVYDEALEKMISCLMKKELTDKIIAQAAFPIKYGGLGININSLEYSKQQLEDCKALSYHICRYIEHDEIINHDSIKGIRNKILSDKKKYWDKKSDDFVTDLEYDHIKRLEEMKTPGSNHWLIAIPVKWKPQWKLSKNEFCDALNLRFNVLPDSTPLVCPAENCLESYNLTHMDSCNFGGLVIKRHDYI